MGEKTSRIRLYDLLAYELSFWLDTVVTSSIEYCEIYFSINHLQRICYGSISWTYYISLGSGEAGIGKEISYVAYAFVIIKNCGNEQLN